VISAQSVEKMAVMWLGMDKNYLRFELGSDWDWSSRRLDDRYLSERLNRSPPHVVADYFEGRGGHRSNIGRTANFEVDEAELLKRDDPLINLALARWGRDSDVLAKVFEQSASGTPERLAVFLNASVSSNVFSSKVFPTENADLLELFRNSTSDERQALAGNSEIGSYFLMPLLSALATSDVKNDQDALFDALVALPANGMITREVRELSETGIRRPLWSLALTLPVEPRWGYRLAVLYRVLLSSKVESFFDKRSHVPDKEVLNDAIQRWAVQEPAAAALELDACHMVSFHLARAGLIARELTSLECLESDLLSMRCASFAEVELSQESSEQLTERGVREEAVFALKNPKNWADVKGRNRLYAAAQQCWDAERNSTENGYLFSFHRNWDNSETAFRDRFPHYFEDELQNDEFLEQGDYTDAANVIGQDSDYLVEPIRDQLKKIDQIRAIAIFIAVILVVHAFRFSQVF
jgi:hypothetical protein